MSGDKGPPTVYRQIKDNAEELLDYLRDLKQWETEIKRKDEILLKEKHENSDESGSNVSLLPSVRNEDTDNVSKKKAKTTKSELLTKQNASKLIEKSKKTKISSYDYASWDKFDADEASKESEDSDENDSENDSETEILKQKQEAEVEKENGNGHLKANRLDEAIGCYTKGFALDPTNPLIPANRALAFIKKEQYAAAEEDCNVALRLDPRYPKGYLRRAAARMGLQKYDRAKEDLLQVLKLEPNNKQAKQELAKIDKISSSMAAVAEKQDSLIVTPIDKPLHLRSKKPLHRIEVIEVLDDDEQSSTTGLEQEDRKTVQNRSVMQPSQTTTTTTTIPCVPTVSNLTSYQFFKDFRRLKSYPEVLYGYVKQIPASKYPQLFQHSLESDVMSKLLLVYKDFYLPNGLDVYPFLLNLSKIKRFSTLRMFFSEDDKNVLHDLFLDLKKEISSEDMDSLMNAYEMKI